MDLQPGLNVLYGPNEAGKSSALRAVHSLLFGFDHQTSDDFIHSYQQLRVGGVLVDSNGRRLECVRRKGRTATLRDGNDEKPIDDSQLQAMLGGVSEEFFSTVFGIDHGRLRAGGEEVVRGRGRIGELLFAAGGITHLREKQLALEETASNLFKPTGRNPRINAALFQLKQLADEIRDLQRSPEEWSRHDAELGRLTEAGESLRRQLADAEAERVRLDRIRSGLGMLASWKAKKAELATLSTVPSLPPNANERFRLAREKQIIAEASKKDATERIANFQEQLQALNVPADLLEYEARIDELYRRLGSHEKAMADRSVLAGQARTARDNAKRSIQKLGWEVELDEAAPRRLPDDKKARVRALSNRFGEVTQGRARQIQLAERARKLLKDQLDRLESMPVLQTPTSLREALASAALVVEAERRLNEHRSEVQRLEHAADDALARLPLRRGELSEICRIKVPLIETVDQFDESRRELIATWTRLSENRETAESECARHRRELLALEMAESVPTEEDLKTVRDTRDRGVRLALTVIAGQEIEPEAVASFVRDVSEGIDLPSALEPSIRQADSVADRLRRESARVAQKSHLVTQLRSYEAQIEALDQQLADVRERQSAWDVQWTNAWKESDIAPATPGEMRAWLRKHAELIELGAGLAKAKEDLAYEEQRVHEFQSLLINELSQCGVDTPAEAILQRLLQLGRNHLDSIETACRARAAVEADLVRLEEEVAATERDLAAAEAELNTWRKEWADALQPLHLSGDALPEQAEAVLTNLDELFRNIDAAESYRTRIWGIDETAKEFSQAARDLCSEVAPDLAELPVEQIVSTLHQRLNASKEARQQVASLSEQVANEKRKLDQEEHNLTVSRAALDVLVEEAACVDLSELPNAIERSTRKSNLQSELHDLESQLAPLCGGTALGEFVADAESEDADRLPSRIEELDIQVKSLREQREEAIKAKERTISLLNQYAGAAAAAEKDHERQFVLSQLEEDAHEFVVATVASRLLHKAVERYRDKTRGPVLSMASDYFRTLTCSAFQGLRSDYDESGQEVLVGVRPGGVTVRVEAMSEGTRDQLYFALRLGTLDYWFERHEPIPLIVDDVLLAFDDGRTSAALGALIDLSKRTQVLLFTHHEHVLSLVHNVTAANGDGLSVNIVKGWKVAA